MVRPAQAGRVTEVSLNLHFHCGVCGVFLLWFMFRRVLNGKRLTEPHNFIRNAEAFVQLCEVQY